MNTKNFDTIPLCTRTWTQLNLNWGKFGVCPNSYKEDFDSIEDFPPHKSVLNDVFNHPRYIKRRQLLGEGEIPEPCSTCCSYSNYGSLRQMMSRDLEILACVEDHAQRIRASENFERAIYSSIMKETHVTHYPINAILISGSKCNIECKFCYNCKMDYSPSAKSILSIVDQIHEHLTYVTLQGGEPLITEAGRALLSSFAGGKYKFAVQLGTNGQWTDFDLIRPVNLADVQISTDAATKEVYEKVRVGGDFNDLIANIKKFNELKKEKPLMKIRTNYTVTSDNFMDIPEACKLYEDIGMYTMFHLVMREKDDPQNIKERPDLYEPLLKKCDEALAITSNPFTKDKLMSIQNTILGKMEEAKKEANEKERL